MPSYDFVCGICQEVQTFVHKMDERDTPHRCVKCGNMMKRKMATGMPFINWAGRWRDQWRNKEGYQDGLGPYGE